MNSSETIEFTYKDFDCIIIQRFLPIFGKYTCGYLVLKGSFEKNSTLNYLVKESFEQFEEITFEGKINGKYCIGFDTLHPYHKDKSAQFTKNRLIEIIDDLPK